MTESLYGWLLLAVALERGVELVVSARNARRAFDRGAVEVGQGHYRVMKLLHTAFLLACAAEVAFLGRPFPGALGWAALGAVAGAQALRWWAVAALGVRWNTRVIVWPDLAPVTGGPYRFVRHPNYVAVVVEIAALPLVHGAWATAVVFSVLNVLLLVVRIRAEETALGPRWAAAFAEAPRFVPGRNRVGAR